MLNHLKSWWVAHMAWLTGVAYVAWPGVRHAMCDYPKVSGSAIALAIFGAFVSRSPFSKAAPPAGSGS